MHMSVGLFLLVVLLKSASSLPCCPDDLQMIYIENMIYCQDFNKIMIYQWCVNVAMINPEEEMFLENGVKTEYTLDNETWYSDYCTGVFSNVSVFKNAALQNLTGQNLGMVCLGDEPDLDHYTLYGICLLISCVFLLVTLLIYLYLPELRDLQGKCFVCFVLSLMIGYLCLGYLQLPLTSPQSNDNQCIISAFLTYFWMLSAFFWLNINSFNMWRSSVLAHIRMSEKKLMNAYYAAGWGLPLCFLAVALTTHHLPGDNIIRPNFGVTSCWFEEKLELWSFFYGPVLILLIGNIVYFISTALYLWSDYRSPNPMPRIKSLRIKFCLYFKLFLVMGITWIFEIFSSIDDSPWYVTDILNCFQGVIIFVVMIVLRKRVWQALAAKQLCGLELRNCCEQMEDEETVHDELMVEHQLASNHIETNKP